MIKKNNNFFNVTDYYLLEGDFFRENKKINL